MRRTLGRLSTWHNRIQQILGNYWSQNSCTSCLLVQHSHHSRCNRSVRLIPCNKLKYLSPLKGDPRIDLGISLLKAHDLWRHSFKPLDLKTRSMDIPADTNRQVKGQTLPALDIWVQTTGIFHKAKTSWCPSVCRVIFLWQTLWSMNYLFRILLKQKVFQL